MIIQNPLVPDRQPQVFHRQAYLFQWDAEARAVDSGKARLRSILVRRRRPHRPQPMRRKIQPSHLFDDLRRQFSDVVVPNDGVTVGKYPLAFDSGGMQGSLPLFCWRKNPAREARGRRPPSSRRIRREQGSLRRADALSLRLSPQQELVECRRPREEGEGDPLNG